MAESSLGPKKKERWAMSSNGIMVPLVSGTCSYSRWLHVILGGTLAFKRSLRHTGCTEGSRAPRAISATVFMNWTNPAASLMVWFSLNAKMNPPHFSRDQGSVENLCRARNIIKELLPTWKWRLKSIPELGKRDVSVGLNKENTLAGAVHH
ncbi:hypothetical protein Ahy_B08g089999 [Arachis hypogaea]|uniref:Uncharacterized protein n=1 Tax=Arachis hypogaea TaxID=3818 RepID=A0A444XZE4_ARAHY|nr:hypothetical protein Ahy_B08g089999 [Arachis hypogaea]